MILFCYFTVFGHGSTEVGEVLRVYQEAGLVKVFGEQGVVLLEQALKTLRGGAEGQPAPSHLELQGSKLVNYPPELRPNIEGMRVASALRAF